MWAGLDIESMPERTEACPTSLGGWHIHCDYLAVGRQRQFGGDDIAGLRARGSSNLERLPRRADATCSYRGNGSCGGCNIHDLR